MAVLIADASVLIAFVDPHDPHHERSVAAIREYRSVELVLPASAYAELLVRPLRLGPRGVEHFDRLLDEIGFRVEPTTAQVARRAAALRARHVSMRLADALVLGTAEVLEADRVLTADRSWSRWSRRVRVL